MITHPCDWLRLSFVCTFVLIRHLSSYNGSTRSRRSLPQTKQFCGVDPQQFNAQQM